MSCAQSIKRFSLAEESISGLRFDFAGVARSEGKLVLGKDERLRIGSPAVER